MGLVEYFGNHINLLDYGEADTLTGLASRKTFDKHLFECSGSGRPARATRRPRGRRRGGSETRTGWPPATSTTSSHQRQFRAPDRRRGLTCWPRSCANHSASTTSCFASAARNSSPAATRYRGRRARRAGTLSAPGRTTVVQPGKITASIGFSALRPNDTPTDVIDRADEALYYAKRHGRKPVDSYERLIAGGELQAKEIAKGEVELF